MNTGTAIFDLDGTLVDNLGFHVKAWLSLCQRLELTVDPRRFETEFNGRKNSEILPALLGRPVAGKALLELSEEKESRYRELYRPEIRPLRGLVSFLEQLQSKKIPCAIATAAPQQNRDFVLQSLHLQGFFSAMVGAEEVSRGKPAPDLFLAAAKKLNAQFERCLVFEDAVNGVLAARSAGMRCVGVTTTASAQDLKAAGAEWTIQNYEEVPCEVMSWLGAS